MKVKSILTTILLFSLCGNVFPQTPSKTEDRDAAVKELRPKVAAMLRETMADIGQLKNRRNRISAGMSVADLMSDVDPETSRTELDRICADLIAEIQEIVSFVEAAKLTPDDFDFKNDAYLGDSVGSLKDKAQNGLARVMPIRRNLLALLARTDVRRAYDYMSETASLLANTQLGSGLRKNDEEMMTSLLRSNAGKQAQAVAAISLELIRAGKIARQAGITAAVYKADSALGASLAETLAEAVRKSWDAGIGAELLRLGIESLDQSNDQPKKPPMLSSGALTALANRVADDLMIAGPDDSYRVAGLIPMVERFAPSRAEAVRRRLKIIAPKPAVPLALPIVRATPAPIPTPVSEADAKLAEQRDAMEKSRSLSKLKLSADERARVVEHARTYMSNSGREARVDGLIDLGQEVLRAGDTALAVSIFNEARSLIPETPKRAPDCFALFKIAARTVQIDRKTSFETIESLLPWLNRVEESLRTFAQFMDLREEDLASDEWVLHEGFRGRLLGDLGWKLLTEREGIRSLLIADFDRTVQIANGFERVEFRILARIALARATIDPPLRSVDDGDLTGRDEALSAPAK